MSSRRDGLRAALRNLMIDSSQRSASSLISSNSKKKSLEEHCPCLMVQSLRQASLRRCGFLNVSRKRRSKEAQDWKENLPSLTSRNKSFLQLDAPPVRKVSAYRIFDSAEGKDEGWESKMFSSELKKFSDSLIEPSKVGRSAILALGLGCC